MADKRISELTAVVAPLGTDEFPCNQAGVTKKETRTQITATVTASLASHMAAIPATHANKSITYALIQDMAQYSVLGRAGAGAGVPGAISPAAFNTVLQCTAVGGTFWGPATVAMMTDGTEIITVPITVFAGGSAVESMDTGDSAHAIGRFQCPADYVSGGTVVWMGHCVGPGNIYRYMIVAGAATGEAATTHTTAVAWAAVPMTAGDKWTVVASANISAWLAAGDSVESFVYRNGADALDTLPVGAAGQVWGYCYFTYTANHGG
jgi:hypothetical protein